MKSKRFKRNKDSGKIKDKIEKTTNERIAKRDYPSCLGDYGYLSGFKYRQKFAECDVNCMFRKWCYEHLQLVVETCYPEECKEFKRKVDDYVFIGFSIDKAYRVVVEEYQKKEKFNPYIKAMQDNVRQGKKDRDGN